MKKTMFSMVMAILIFATFPARAGDVRPAEAILSDLIREALDNNPSLQAAAQRALASEKMISQAGALPDPQLTLGLMNLPVNSFAFNQEPMTGKIISLMQMFPFPGKLALAEDMAEFEASAVGHQQEELRNQVVQMVKQAYYDLYAVDRALETVEKNKALMEQFVRVAETKYVTGSGIQQDVLRAQVELSQLEDDLIMWGQKRVGVTARLNALLNRPPSSPIEKIPADLSRPGEIPIDFDLIAIEKKRPLLRAWQERIRKTETAVKLARRDLWPNITVGASYSQRDDLENGARMHDFFSATVSLNLPLYFERKQKARIAEKTLDLAAAEADYKNILVRVMADVEGLKAELERNRKRVELYDGGILLQAQQSLDSAQAGYKVGKVDFLTLINNWMMLQNYELQYYFALADYHKALAGCELAAGEEISLGEAENESRENEKRLEGVKR